MCEFETAAQLFDELKPQIHEYQRRIARLEADNARLRKALERIMNREFTVHGPHGIARAALNPSESPP